MNKQDDSEAHGYTGELFDRVVQVVEQEFFDEHFLSVQWPELKAGAYRSYTATDCAAERETILQGLIASLSMSHTLLITPELSAQIEEAESNAVSSQLRCTSENGVAFATLTSFQVSGLRHADISDIAQTLSDDAHTLILDLRINGGGSFRVAADFAGIFLEPSTILCRVRDRTGFGLAHPVPLDSIDEKYNLDHSLEIELIRTHHFTEFRTPKTANAIGPHFSGKVIILIGRECHSSAEVFAYCMKESGRATLVGERSNGAVVAGMVFELGGDFGLLIPFADLECDNGARIEGIGVKPHIEIDLAEAQDPASVLQALRLADVL